MCGPSSYPPQPDSLFRNRGDGTFEEVGVAGEAGGEVDREVRLARRKPDGEPVALSAARVAVMMAAEADDLRAPHLGLGPGGPSHEIGKGDAVGAAGVVRENRQGGLHILPATLLPPQHHASGTLDLLDPAAGQQGPGGLGNEQQPAGALGRGIVGPVPGGQMSGVVQQGRMPE